MADVKALTIFLAEDNVDHAELITDSLKEFNIANEILHFCNGESLLQYLRKEAPYTEVAVRPDLILLDLKMPRLDGISTLREIRSDDMLKSIPVLIVTTSSTDAEIEACYKLGANSYITKPLQFDEFNRKIKELNLYWVLTSELPRRPE